MPRKPKPQTVLQAVESGDHDQVLIAIRAKLAQAFDDPATPGYVLPRLSRELDEVQKEIDARRADSPKLRVVGNDAPFDAGEL